MMKDGALKEKRDGSLEPKEEEEERAYPRENWIDGVQEDLQSYGTGRKGYLGQIQ